VTPDVQGLLYPSGDEEALAAELHRLIGDAGLRKRLGTAGGILARNDFSTASMVRSMEAVYTECLPL
jgi:glycosyltransferase involved in cell wall biosynthesis